MTNNYESARRWVDVQEGRATRYIGHRLNVFGDDRALYSYGSHFPLIVPMRDESGALVLYLLNGDRYSVSTTRHQSIARSVIADSDVPSVIIPFSAITAASIDRKTIRPLEIRPDRYSPVMRRCAEPHTYHQHDADGHYVGTEECLGGSEHVYQEHHLGDSLFVANVVTRPGLQVVERRGVRFVSSFDYSGTIRSVFPG
jgi:hypothetical protein